MLLGLHLAVVIASRLNGTVPGVARARRESFKRLWVPQMSFYSESAADLTFRMNERILRTSLIWPKIGSMIAWRRL